MEQPKPSSQAMRDAPTTRLMSLDAYRGFVMLAMASAGFSLARACKSPLVLNQFDGTGYQRIWHRLCEIVAFNTEHVEWGGCSFWDLIQPSFMFMVGVALPYSYARRAALQQGQILQFLHVLQRSAVLILLGIFLSSNWSPRTNFVFTNVLTQIGMGYPFLWLLRNRGLGVQITSAALILVTYWFAFFNHDPGNVIAPAGAIPEYSELASHWNKFTNWAAAVDQTFLNWFPQYSAQGERIPFRPPNDGGYTTLNFIPSIVTMLLGLMTGELLRSQRSPQRKTAVMLAAGAFCLIAAIALDPARFPLLRSDWSVCPIVKRIWTPTWVLYSGGWSLWMLATFYWIIDVRGWKFWAFPLTVVGMNSIAIYCMSQLLRPWITKSLRIHFGPQLFSGDVGRVSELASQLLVMWLICLWLYRQKIFIKI